jgi:signal transduction histidine kinase
MTSAALTGGRPSEPHAQAGSERGALAERRASSALDRLDAHFERRTPDRLRAELDEARRRARFMVDGSGADGLAATTLAADVLAALAAEGLLGADDVTAGAAEVAAALDAPAEVARLELFVRFASSPALDDMPGTVAAELVLLFLEQLGVAFDLSLWVREPGGVAALAVSTGSTPPTRRVRSLARRAVTRGVRAPAASADGLWAATVTRFGSPQAAIVARGATGGERCGTYLEEAAFAIARLLERERLLERSTEREQALVASAERRLVRLGFDLHDGPIQEVLALAGEVRHLRDLLAPHVADEHREIAQGRFDDVLARLAELDRHLRELSHSLESRSIVSRPLSEILHRETEAFTGRTGIRAALDLRGDVDSLTSAQRVAVFRAIQESLANIREHSGASRVDILFRVRRNWIEARVVDDGHGFEVSRALARAAQRGRLGLVGIAERVRMLGGTFEVESAPGGPTTLSFSLPRALPEA